MSTAADAFRTLVSTMMEQESAGNRSYFDQLLAPQFAMRSADLFTFRGRDEFLDGVAPSPERILEDLDIALQTPTIAVLRCTIRTPRNGEWRQFNNIQVFVRAAAEETWKLLSWTNEPLSGA